MKLAIFDIDGTLTNTNKVDDECFVRAFAETYEITKMSTDWAAYPHTTDSGIAFHVLFEKFGREPNDAELDRLRERFMDLMRQRCRLASSAFAEIAGASVALSRLKREPDWALAIATGCWRESALLKLAAAKLEVAEIPAGYAEDGLSRESILKAAVSRSLIRYRESGFEKIVSIGDGVWDVRAARREEFAFLGVGTGAAAEGLRRAGAGHVVNNLGDYDDLISRLSAAEIPGAEAG